MVKDGEDTFVCGTCAEMIGRVEVEGECGATLVVCPTPILRQWQDEISRSFSTHFSTLFSPAPVIFRCVIGCTNY